MDLSKLQNPRGVSSAPGASRLVMLIILALVVVFAFFFFNQQSYKGDELIINPEDHVQAPEVHRIPGAIVEPELLKNVRDGDNSERVVKEKEPYLHLIRQSQRLVYGDMELLGVKAASAGEIRKDPGTYRGQPLEIKGNLQWFEKITDLDFVLYRGYLTSYEGDYFYFTVLDMDPEVIIGDVVKLQGFFFKLYSFNLTGEDHRINDAVFLIGKHLVPSFYKMPPVLELDQRIMDTLYDYDIRDMTKPFDEKPLYHMLSYVYNMDEETYASFDFPELKPIEILKKPGQYRGKPVKVLGEVVWLDAKYLGPDGENPVGPRKVFHGILCNYRGLFAYFLAFDLPEWIAVESKDLVYVDGFFFRNYAYRTRSENLQPAPVIIARGFDKFILPKDYTFHYISFAILGGTALVILFFFFHVFRDRRQGHQYREKFIARKKKQLTRMMSANPEIGEGGSPSPRDNPPQPGDPAS